MRILTESITLGGEMLVQLHMQNMDKPKETKFIVQEEVHNQEDINDWFNLCRDITKELEDTVPDGWTWMVCDEKANCFIHFSSYN